MKLCALILPALLLGVMQAQVHSGTIVVIGITEQKIVVAVDSRNVAVQRGERTQRDDDCKLRAIKHKFVFASSGLIGFDSHTANSPIPSWDNFNEAKDAVRMAEIEAGDKPPTVERVGDIWVQKMLNFFTRLYLFAPEVITANERQERLTIGFFAAAENAELHYALRLIAFDTKNLVRSARGEFPTGCHPLCGFGESEVFDEFNMRTSKRAKEESRRWAASHKRSNVTALAIRLANLTAKYEAKGTVGGPIDAIELSKNGRIHWAARKSNCHDNEE